jgi:hypothetical protein
VDVLPATTLICIAHRLHRENTLTAHSVPTWNFNRRERCKPYCSQHCTVLQSDLELRTCRWIPYGNDHGPIRWAPPTKLTASGSGTVGWNRLRCIRGLVPRRIGTILTDAELISYSTHRNSIRNRVQALRFGLSCGAVVADGNLTLRRVTRIITENG